MSSVPPTCRPEESYFALLPIVGEYCDSNTLTIVQTSSYRRAFEPESDPDNFRVTIPVATLATAAFFDPDHADQEPSQG